MITKAFQLVCIQAGRNLQGRILSKEGGVSHHVLRPLQCLLISIEESPIDNTMKQFVIESEQKTPDTPS